MTDFLEYMNGGHTWMAWYKKGEALKRKDIHDSPSREIPSKVRRQERAERPTSFNLHRDRRLENSKKCAGTQTPFSSFNGEPPQYSEAVSVQDQSRRDGVNSVPYTTNHMCPNGYMTNQVTNHRSSRDNMDSSPSSPLNLSISSKYSQQQRPSVITCVSTTTTRTHNSSPPPAYPGSSSRWVETAVDLCDPAIEEHFRRSLGKNYPEYLSASPTPSPRSHSPSTPTSSLPTSTASPIIGTSPIVTTPVAMTPVATTPTSPPAASPTTAVKANTEVSVTGSVDDHFARALGGSTWSEIKAKKDPVQPDILAGSVDDHFAKALGDKWLKIKAEQEDKSRRSSTSSACASPHHNLSSDPTPNQPQSSGRNANCDRMIICCKSLWEDQCW